MSIKTPFLITAIFISLYLALHAMGVFESATPEQSPPVAQATPTQEAPISSTAQALPSKPACAASDPANPFRSANQDCTPVASHTESAPIDAKIANANAQAVGKALLDVGKCNGNARCNETQRTEVKQLTNRLENLTGQGDAQARFELAMAIQRDKEGLGRSLQNEADVAVDTDLQRAVALLAEAVAAGNADAIQFKQSLGSHAKLLHTGR